jgi:hypothetical protein
MLLHQRCICLGESVDCIGTGPQGCSILGVIEICNIYSQTPNTLPLYILPPFHYAHENLGRDIFPCNFRRNPLVKCHPYKPPSAVFCSNTNVLLSIIIKSDTVLCDLFSTSYVDSPLEYLVVKILFMNTSTLTYKTYSCNSNTGEEVGLLLGNNSVNGDIPHPDSYSK